MKKLTLLKSSFRTLRLSSTSSGTFIDPFVTNKNVNVNNQNPVDWNDAIAYDQIPGPRAIPVLGNSWRFLPFFGDYKIQHIDQVSQRLQKQFGDIVRISGLLGRPDMVFLYDPDEIKKVFRVEDRMPHRPSMPSLDYYKHKLRKDFFGNDAGVIAVHGQNWHDFRMKVQQLMLQPKIVRQYTRPIEETADRFLERIDEIRDENGELPDDFLNYINKWSLESIARVALDVQLGCLDEPLTNPCTQELIDAVNTFFVNVPVLELKIPFWRVFRTPTWVKYINALDVITNVSMKHINNAMERMSQNGPVNEPSLVQRVLQETKNPKIASILALDLFIVGIDTTATTVASILYQLSQHPSEQEKLYDELKTILPNKSDQITTEKLNEAVYLRACVKETLRKFPTVIGNGRLTTNNYVVKGYQIPKGVQIIFQHYTMSNDDSFFANASKFLPERWIENKSHHPFASLPFGHGRRMCLGRRFADLEIQMVISKIVRSYRIEYNHAPLKYHVHPLYIPNGPLKFKMIPRT